MENIIGRVQSLLNKYGYQRGQGEIGMWMGGQSLEDVVEWDRRSTDTKGYLILNEERLEWENEKECLQIHERIVCMAEDHLRASVGFPLRPK